MVNHLEKLSNGVQVTIPIYFTDGISSYLNDKPLFHASIQERYGLKILQTLDFLDTRIEAGIYWFLLSMLIVYGGPWIIGMDSKDDDDPSDNNPPILDVNL